MLLRKRALSSPSFPPFPSFYHTETYKRKRNTYIFSTLHTHTHTHDNPVFHEERDARFLYSNLVWLVLFAIKRFAMYLYIYIYYYIHIIYIYHAIVLKPLVWLTLRVICGWRIYYRDMSLEHFFFFFFCTRYIRLGSNAYVSVRATSISLYASVSICLFFSLSQCILSQVAIIYDWGPYCYTSVGRVYYIYILACINITSNVDSGEKARAATTREHEAFIRRIGSWHLPFFSLYVSEIFV